ncbi:MAG TPA: SLC13 family permease [Vicinamibacterales bacterium]|nr:SLC13 family permease [Vicinamibacterales bacterium]
MQTHLIGVAGLVVVFVIGTLRPINLGALGLVATFLVGALVVGESVGPMFEGFPVDLLVLLTGITYLFGIAANNGTVAVVVESAAGLVKGRPALIPWMVFVVASLPAMGGALGSAGVALLAPIALRLARRYGIDRRMIGLLVVHGAAAGNFSPLNVLGAIVQQAVTQNGFAISMSMLFFGNLVYNVGLAVVIVAVCSRRGETRLSPSSSMEIASAPESAIEPHRARLGIDQICTVIGLLLVAVGALVFGLNIGLLAMTVAVTLHLIFPRSSGDATAQIAWGVVLLVCGIVTYVAALQRYGTVDAVGAGIADMTTPLVAGLLLCGVGAVTSAFASSAGILGALVPLALPLMAQGALHPTGVVVALAISATVVDATPFSTVGALVVANAEEDERPRVYRGLLAWGAIMVATAPFIAWLLFIVIPSLTTSGAP